MASYAEVAARNANQTAEEASAPPIPTIESDVASYSTGLDDTSSSTSGPSGVHVINRDELSELNTSDEPLTDEPGPSITVNQPIVKDESAPSRSKKDEVKDKLTGKKKLTPKEKKYAVFGGVGTLNCLALGVIGYWGYKRYTAGGENGWKILGIAVGAWAGLSAIEFLTVRGYAAWKDKRHQS